jgi:Sushi repeat (SCR repeat)
LCSIKVEIKQISDNCNDEIFGDLCQGDNEGISLSNDTGRLYGIRLTTTRDLWPVFVSTFWSLEGQSDDQPEWQKLRIVGTEIDDRNYGVLFILENEQKLIRVRFVSPASCAVCVTELLTYHDDCGHPEVPVNGKVDWNDTNAIYRCGEGFQLISGSRTRWCDQGRWTGSEPICMKFAYSTNSLSTEE